LWENGNLRFRDIHLFNENFPSVYTDKKAISNECSFFTLPFVDGYQWSTTGKMAGLRFKALVDGKEILIEGGNPIVQDAVPGKLHISWPLKSFNATLVMDIDEQQIKMQVTGGKSINWFLDLTAAPGAILPFTTISPASAGCRFEEMNYSVTAANGTFSKPNDSTIFRITPHLNTVVLNLAGTNESK
jgi:hypothetical protein